MIITKNIWNQFLSLKEEVDRSKEGIDLWLFDGNTFYSRSKNDVEADQSSIALLSKVPLELCSCITDNCHWCREEIFENQLYLYYRETIDIHILDILRLYWPLSILGGLERDKTFLMVHIAQTLDGKIATSNGASKWIGNQENLVHAHRLRALVDGIMVGGNTVRNDNPSLNVRHVKGNNPVRLILSNKINNFGSLPKVENMKTFLIRDESFKESKVMGVDKTLYYKNNTKVSKTSAKAILELVYDCGIKSVLLEGGASTIMQFVESGNVDYLQIHIAPMIFGSGKSGLTLDDVEEIDEAYNLKNNIYSRMGDAIMVSGEITKNSQ